MIREEIDPLGMRELEFVAGKERGPLLARIIATEERVISECNCQNDRGCRVVQRSSGARVDRSQTSSREQTAGAPMSEVTLRGVSWDHPRGHDCMVATADAYRAIAPGVSVQWQTRSLQDFADFPVQKLAESYDLLIIDHPFVGFAATDGCLFPLDELVSPDLLADQAAQQRRAQSPQLLLRRASVGAGQRRCRSRVRLPPGPAGRLRRCAPDLGRRPARSHRRVHAGRPAARPTADPGRRDHELLHHLCGALVSRPLQILTGSSTVLPAITRWTCLPRWSGWPTRNRCTATHRACWT